MQFEKGFVNSNSEDQFLKQGQMAATFKNLYSRLTKNNMALKILFLNFGCMEQ